MEATQSSSINEKKIPLTFGSIISFSSITDIDSFIYVDGFVKHKIHVKKFKDNHSNLIYSKCLFQIYPTLINTNKRKALKYKKQEGFHASNPIEEQKRIDTITELQDNVVTEFKINLESFKKVIGQPVTFGQSVQFLHIASNKFLSYSRDEAKLERQNYQAGLEEYSNESTVFKFLPCYKHQKDSEGTIFLSDSVYIASISSILNKVPYLHISNPIAVNINKQKLAVVNSEKMQLAPLDKKDATKKKIKTEVNVSLESQTRMKMNYYSSYIDTENNYLECGDVVWLNHSELAATLVCVTQFKNENFTSRIEFDGNRITDHFKQFIGNTNGMWMIEHEDYQKGGLIQWDESYRFKHIGTGSYLAVKNLRGKGEVEAKERIILEAQPNEDNKFVFVPVASTLPKSSLSRQFVTRDTFALIMHKKTKFVIHGTYEKDEVLKKFNQGDDAEASVFGEIKPFLATYSAVSEQAAFKVIKANFNEVWETNFLISCFPLLKRFLANIMLANKKGAIDKLFIAHLSNKVESTSKCVEDLDKFCNNKQFNSSPDQKYGEVNTFRQKLLREQYFIDILVTILKEMLNKDELELFETYKNMKVGSEAYGNMAFQGGTYIQVNEQNESKGPLLGEYARKYLEPKADKTKLALENLNFVKKKVQLCHHIYSLLKSICKENYENEIYTYNLIPQFLIQCKYLPEAVDCVMSIIQKNEYILTKLNENVKMNIDSKMTQKANTNVINIIINIKNEPGEEADEENIKKSQALKPIHLTAGDYAEENDKKSKISKPVNLINFFLNLLKGKNNQNTNAQFLTFFRNICCKDRVGLTINQDLLYKIFNYNPNFVRSFMITFQYENDNIEVEFPSSWTEIHSSEGPLSIIKCYHEKSSHSKPHIKFLEEQLNLYSDLALSRNYLWKVELEKKFPPSTVFNMIWNPRFPKPLRAAMCKLALTVYIDHEPFDELNLPRMCRVYEKVQKSSGAFLNNIIPNFKLKSMFSKEKKLLPDNGPKQHINIEELDDPEMQNELLNLIENIMTFFKDETEQINTDLDAGTQKQVKSQKGTRRWELNGSGRAISPQPASKTIIKNNLDDALLLNVTQLFSKLISFDALRMAGKQGLLYQVVSNFIQMLEYDPKHLAHSFLLNKLRKTNIDKRKENIKKKDLISISGFKNVMGSVVDNFTEITGTLGDLLSITQQKANEENKRSGVNEMDEQNTYNNPTMRSMLSLLSFLERLKYDDDDTKDKMSIKVKLEICNTLDFLLDMRKNYLISNFLAWFQSLEDKLGHYVNTDKFDEKIEKRARQGLPLIMPAIPKTGILDLDEEFAPKAEEIDLKTFTTIFQKAEMKKTAKFTHFIENAKDHPDYVPDLDTLLLGAKSEFDELSSDVLPSLLISFLNTKDTVLESRLLDVVMRIFNQRTELLDALQNLEVLFDPVEKRSYEFVERQSAKLKGLTEKLEVWLGRFIDGTGGNNEIIQVTLLLEQLTMLLDTHNSVERDGSLTIKDEKVKNVSESRQNIMKYLETYKPVLTISKNGLYALDKIILDEHVDEDKKRILVTLFVKSHFFLQQFCKNNETNQSIMAPHCDTLLRYAHLDVGQVPLLCSIYEGNRFLCETIPDSFLTKFINLIENEGRQAHFLRLLKIIQKVDALYIPENQIRVLRSLVSSDESDFDKLALILYASHDPAQHEFMFEFDDYLSLDTEEDLVTKLAQHGFKDTYRDQPFVYHAQLLDLLTDTIRGTESFNMSKAKLKRLFSFDHLLDLLTHQDSLTVTEAPNIVIDDEPGKAYEMDLNVLRNLQTAKGIFKKETTMGRTKTINEKAGVSNQKARGFSIIKSKIVDFLIELYLNASTKVVGEFSGYQNSFEILIEKEITRLEQINDETRFEPEFFTYFFKSLLTLLDCYASKVLGDSKHASDFVKGKSNTLFYKFLSTLMQTLPKFKKRLTYEQKENLAAFLNMYAKILKKENDSDDEFGFLVTDHEEPVEVLQPLRFLSDELSPSPMSKKHSSAGGVWATKDNWLRLLDFFDKENPKCEAALDEEKVALSKAVVRFTEIFSTQDKDEHRVTIESKDIIKKFIKYLQYGFSNKAKKETMISTLQTLKQMVDKEDPKERQRLQNMVDSYDGTKMLLTVLSDSSNQAMDTEILNHFLELGIKLLEGGNTRIQKNIYHYFITFQRSEVLFSKLHSIITSYSNGLKRNSKASKTGDVENPIEEYAQTGGSKLLENTLRLLQLFTEGHYLDLQNYIRYQTNSRNNYDMVAAVTELLRSYLNHMNQANYESIMRCLDTLAEFVQGPCPENQVGLIDGKFFDVATAILTDYGKKAKKTSFVSIKRQESNLFDLSQSHTGAGRMHKWMIARLKYKTLVLVLSLIEMRKDSSVIKRIMRSLSVDVLKRTLAKVWKRYKGLYGTKYTADALGHHEEDPRVVPKETDPKQKYNYYDVITEAGFAAYFLLETYYEVNDFDADRDVVNDVMLKKMQSNTKKDNIFQASIIGQFGSFGVSMLKQGFDMANLLKNQVNNNLLKIIAGGSKEEEQKIMKEIELKKLVREGMKFFAEHSAHIEVLRNKRPETVHFYLPPHCHFLPKEIKTNFNDSVDRSNIQTKASGLTQSSHEIIRIMEHEEKLDQFFSKNKFVALFATHVNLWKDLAFFVTLIVNFFIISSYSTFFGTQTDPFYLRLKNPRFWLQENWDWTFNVIWILGIIMAVSSIFVVVFFMLKKIPLIISQIWYKPPQATVQKKRKKGVISRLMGLIAKVIQTMVELLMTPIIVYYIMYGTFALLGVIVHPFFLTFHLTEILVRYPTLRDVIRAFWDPRKSLLLTLMLFIVAEYFFSLIAYYFLYEDYAGNCNSTLLCFLYTFDYTFKANGGIGGQLESLTEREPGPYRIGRFFFDNIFNIAVVIVLVAIVAGIIIDTFGSLREKDKEKMDDLQEICFTCGCDRETYDRKSDLKGGFTRHIKIDHYMWNYVHYIAYLKSKDPTDYTGIESYINDKLKDGDVSWFPSHKAIMLDNAGDEDAKHEEEITYIDESCQETKKVAKNLINTLRIIRKKLHVKH